MTVPAPARLVAFAVALAVLFSLGVLAGRLVDPAAPRGAAADAERAPGR